MKLCTIAKNLIKTCRECHRLYRLKGGHYVACLLRYSANSILTRQLNRYAPTIRVKCPCCGWQGYEFLPVYESSMWNRATACPQCGSHPRQRGLWEYIRRFDKDVMGRWQRVLHFAPESSLTACLGGRPNRFYIGTDFDRILLKKLDSAFQADITSMAIADNSVDCIVCIHVLEHIKDEAQAIREIRRILKDGGIAYIMVPINPDRDEDEDYGEANEEMLGHYRTPGRLYARRLTGFHCDEIDLEKILLPEEISSMRIKRYDIIYRCTK